MDTLEPLFKTTFAAQIRALDPSENEIKEVKASLSELKTLLPEGINPEDDPQLLYISANLYVAGMVNKNDDGVDIETSLATYKRFAKQQLNIEHDRGRVAGYILNVGLSEFGTDRIISEDEAREKGRPFNVAVAAVLWKVNNPKLCAYLTEASNPTHPDFKSLSLSFEVGFSSYNIGVIDSETRVISEATKMYTPADAEFEDMAKKLRTNGGSGRVTAESTEGVYQILAGTFLPLGGGIVTTPAAAVKGIIAITESVHTEETEINSDHDNDEDDIVTVKNEEPEDEKDTEECKQEDATLEELRIKLNNLMALLEKKSKSHIISHKTSVSPYISKTITHSNMNKALLQQMKEKVASAEKPEDMKQVFAGVMEIAEAITSESEKIHAALEAEKAHGAEIEKNRAEAQAANEELKKNYDVLKSEMEQMKAAQLALEAASRFDERMASIEEEFEFDDEERAMVIDEVKALDETAFAGWMAKAKKMMKEKTKLFKKAQKEDKQKKTDEMCAALKAKGITVTVDENDLFKEIIASAQNNNISAPITNSIETETQSLAERAKAEFMENASIGGKKLNQFNK